MALTNTKSTRKRSPGRPDRGVLQTYKPVIFYLTPAMLDALNRQADREQRQSGATVSRVDVVRKAIAQYLARHGGVPQEGAS
jgi:hypothetical protein